MRLELDTVQEQEEKFMDDVLQFCKELPPSEQREQLEEFVNSEMDRRGIESAEVPGPREGIPGRLWKG